MAVGKPLHLTDAIAQFSQRDTARQLIVFVCQQQPSGWRRVSSRQFSQFFFEVLKDQIESEPGFVFAEESARPVDVIFVLNLTELAMPFELVVRLFDLAPFNAG